MRGTKQPNKCYDVVTKLDDTGDSSLGVPT